MPLYWVPPAVEVLTPHVRALKAKQVVDAMSPGPVEKIVSRFENDYWPLRPYEATITCNIVIIVLVFVFYGLCDSRSFTTYVNAELHAIMVGLPVAWDSGSRSVVCESDSLLALQMLDQNEYDLHPYASIIAKINNFKYCN
ncbi:hypothetical protein JHK87_034435 [Glycine soja]|nr:hypothetical protein JHK87_034435 [Glycine soja]